MQKMIQAHLYISGYVHSVGFRRFVQKEAMKRELTGWVRNLSDRRVEALVQGEKEKIEEVIALCHKGPMMAEVKSVNVTWGEGDEEFTTFDLLPTF
jgi:acylphosphatase